MLGESVSMQMQADVPVGILLSGGVDSSLITAIASRYSSNIQTFSVGFKNSPKYNEVEYAQLIANHFGTNHTELYVENNNSEDIPKLAAQFDEPMADSSILPTYLVCKSIKKHCKVALGGDGGDELFGGYPHYKDF